MKISDGILVSDLLKEVEPHDQPILDLLMVDRNEMTKIQLANHFKRSRSDVGFSLERLKIGGHINQAKYNYGKWYAVNYDFSEEIISKRPGEAVEKINRMAEEIVELREALEKSSEVLRRQLSKYYYKDEVAMLNQYESNKKLLNQLNDRANGK